MLGGGQDAGSLCQGMLSTTHNSHQGRMWAEPKQRTTRANYSVHEERNEAPVLWLSRRTLTGAPSWWLASLRLLECHVEQGCSKVLECSHRSTRLFVGWWLCPPCTKLIGVNASLLRTVPGTTVILGSLLGQTARDNVAR